MSQIIEDIVQGKPLKPRAWFIEGRESFEKDGRKWERGFTERIVCDNLLRAIALAMEKHPQGTLYAVKDHGSVVIDKRITNGLR